jgi:hypothetical protein
MVYMAADNDLSNFAEMNLLQMQRANQNDAINVIAFVDWPQASDTYVYRLRNNTREVIERIPNVPSNERQYLQRFLSTTISQYPATNYCVILWGHGDGIDWIYKDEPKAEAIFTDARGNMMKISELGAALDSFPGGQISVLGFDACLMGMAEVYEQIRKSAKYIVGSCDEVPKNGLPYDRILGKLAGDPSISPGDLGKLIVDEFVDSYSHSSEKANVSFALCNPRFCNDLAVGVRALVIALTGGLKQPAILKAIVGARTRGQLSQENSYVDLGCFCSVLEASGIEELRAQAGAVSRVLNGSYVVHERRFPSDGQVARSGLSIFFPNSLQARKDRHQPMFKIGTLDAHVDWPSYRSLAFAIDTGWDAFIKAFTERLA